MGNTPKRPKTRKQSTSSPAATPRDTAAIWRRIGIGVALVLALALVAWMAIPQESATAGIPEGSVNSPATTRNHIEGAISYEVLPPPGGDHNPIWLNCGVYREPVPTENAVHALEHAAVWITYQPGLDADSVGSLEDIGFDRRKVIVSPFPDQESPIMLTSWGWQLSVTDVDDPRIMQYVREFESAGEYAPEPAAVCSGGIGAPA